MDIIELKREQQKLSGKIILKDLPAVKTIGGMECIALQNKLIATVVVCEASTLKPIEKQTYVLSDPLPHKPGFEAYREMPALIEAYNLLEQEPDLLLVKGVGILHPRKIGLASHVGLILNKPTIGIVDKLPLGRIEKGKIFLGSDIVGFEIITRQHAKPVYVSPGHLVSLGSVLNLIPKTILFPHKMPEPIHLAHKTAKKKAKEIM